MMILREVFSGARRFEEIELKLQLGRNILSERLRTLADEGILERRPYQQGPVRYEYVLTQKGEDLYPVLLAMLRWGNKYMVDEPLLQLLHRTCGHLVDPVTVCRACRTEIHRKELSAYFAPDAW